MNYDKFVIELCFLLMSYMFENFLKDKLLKSCLGLLMPKKNDFLTQWEMVMSMFTINR